jgi:hypothetical protein
VREDTRVEASIPVVEGQQDCFVGQSSEATRRSRHIVERYRLPAGAFQPIQELHERLGRYGIGAEIGRLVDDIVKGNRYKALTGRLRARLRRGDDHEQEAKHLSQNARISTTCQA